MRCKLAEIAFALRPTAAEFAFRPIQRPDIAEALTEIAVDI